MTNALRTAFITLLVLACGASPSPAAAASAVPIIFDSDMGGDCDDAGALFLLHGAVQRGEARLLATMGCTSSETIAPCLDAINTWFGRSSIPVGTLKDEGFLIGSSFTREIAERFPHRLPASADYPDAVALYRQILAAQPDGSVVIVAVGPLRNLANLLRSKPDAASASDGRALIAKKVQALHVMGGKYPPEANRKEAEYNFLKDPASAALVAATWPTSILFNGEGGSTNSGRRVTYEMPEHNPMTMAYAAYPGVGFAGDRLSWDPVSCLVAVRGAAPWYQVVRGGRNVVDAATGLNTWQPGEEQSHAYLVLKSPKERIETALEDLMVAGLGRPENITFNTTHYVRSGMGEITARGASEAGTAGVKAFDGDEKTAWLDKAATSWIQCQYADGRRYAVTSYVVVCPDQERLPRSLELSGSNDGGTTWTRLDRRDTPAFNAETRRQEFTVAAPGKWNLYRLGVTAMTASEGVRIATIELAQTIRCRPGVAVAAVMLDPPALTLTAGNRATLNATLAPLDTFDREVVWTSSDPAIADVRRIGEQIAVVAARRPGTCVITADIGKIARTCRVTVTPSSLPPDWRFDELSNPPIPGSVSVADGKFTVTGCGHAMTSWWERVRDQGVFVSQATPGQATLSARLTSLAPNVGGPAFSGDHRPPTSAGLMIREPLTEAAGRYVLIQVTATGKLVCRWRSKSGDQDDNAVQDLGPATLPIHLRLVQSAHQTEVFTSPDGQNWSGPRHTIPATFDAPSRLGMFVCSGSTFSSATAVFEAIALTHPTPATP